MSKSLLRIIAVVAVAALIFGTVAAALGTLAAADHSQPQHPTPAHTSIPSELWNDVAPTPDGAGGSKRVR